MYNIHKNAQNERCLTTKSTFFPAPLRTLYKCFAIIES